MEVCTHAGTTYTVTLTNTIVTGQNTLLTITTQGQTNDGVVIPSTFASEALTFVTNPNGLTWIFDTAPIPNYFKSINVDLWSKELGTENIMDI